MNITEKYRPRDFAEIVGQEKAVAKLNIIGRNGYGGKSIWISGPSGCGKTTLAKIIAEKHTQGGITYEYESADRFLQADVDRMIKDLSMRPLCKACWIINEAHGLAARIVRQLLGVLERLPEWACIVFTTTLEGESGLFDGANEKELTPWFRRVSRVQLARRLEKGAGNLSDMYAARAHEIAKAEGLDGGNDIDAFKKLMQACGNSFGLALQKIDDGEMIAA